MSTMLSWLNASQISQCHQVLPGSFRFYQQEELQDAWREIHALVPEDCLQFSSHYGSAGEPSWSCPRWMNAIRIAHLYHFVSLLISMDAQRSFFRPQDGCGCFPTWWCRPLKLRTPWSGWMPGTMSSWQILPSWRSSWSTWMRTGGGSDLEQKNVWKDGSCEATKLGSTQAVWGLKKTMTWSQLHSCILSRSRSSPSIS